MPNNVLTLATSLPMEGFLLITLRGDVFVVGGDPRRLRQCSPALPRGTLGRSSSSAWNSSARTPYPKKTFWLWCRCGLYSSHYINRRLL